MKSNDTLAYIWHWDFPKPPFSKTTFWANSTTQARISGDWRERKSSEYLRERLLKVLAFLKISWGSFGENPLFGKILENRGSSYQKSHIKASGRAKTFIESSLKSSEITVLRDLIYIQAGNFLIVKKVIFLKKGVLGNLNVIYLYTGLITMKKTVH